MKRCISRCLLALTLLLASPAILAADAAKPLLVYAAASLKGSLDEALAEWKGATGQDVSVSYAASSALARQIEQGAPADVFISADTEWMDYLQERNLIDAASRRNLLGNTLVLVAPASAEARTVALRPGVDLAPLLEGGRIALGMTNSVPAGKYARAAFTSLGIWDQVQPHVAETENVRAALMLVARGEAPLGVVYGTDAKAEPKVRVLGTFPADSHPAIVYPIARLKGSPHARSAELVEWLDGPAGGAVFRKHGFTLTD